MSLYDLATAWTEKKLVYQGGCRRFVAVSGLTKDIFLTQYPIDPDQVAVISPGVDPDDFERPDRESIRKEIRAKYGFEDHELVLVFASMNFEIKGLDAIIEALGVLKTSGTPFRLIVAGKGNAGKYARLAQKAGVAEQLVFTGHLEKAELIRHYLAGDAYIMLSAFDTFGMVVLEAMAAGLPVIISNTVGARDVVMEGKNGFVISKPDDARAIAEKIRLLAVPAARATLSSAARATARKNTWKDKADCYFRLYEAVLAEKAASERVGN